MLDLDELSPRLDAFDRRVFRLECLPLYTVESDGVDFRRWCGGEAEPTWERKRPWLDHLRADTAAGRTRWRVRIFSEEMSDYERYACSWGYALNSEAGEQIRVLRRGEHVVPDGLVERDFWVVDDREVLLMHYDELGRFEAAEVAAEIGPYLATRDAAWAAGEPFGPWWARHPEIGQVAV